MSDKTVRKELKKFDKFFRPYQERLVEHYGRDLARKVKADTLEGLKAILPRTPAFSGRMNLFNLVIGLNARMVSFHKAMRANGRTVEDTGRILFGVARDEFEAILHARRRLPQTVKKLARNVITWPPLPS